jgi:hypothetical protein
MQWANRVAIRTRLEARKPGVAIAASELLASVLEQEEQDSEEAIQAISKG